MVSLTIFRLFFVIFLGSISLIKRAQSEFFKDDAIDKSIGNLRGSIDDGNIQKVIDILRDNIKQWSFIESQLLEPNVDVSMPEIFIPLKHLTTTLELLGNILYVKNDLLAARDCLERACPLMELLPSSLVDTDLNDELLQKAIDMSRTPIKHIELYKGTHSPYAANCFSLLRDVYLKLYGTNGTFLSVVTTPLIEQGNVSQYDDHGQNTAATLFLAAKNSLLSTSGGGNTAATIKMSNFDHSYDDDDYLDDPSTDYYTSGSISSFAVLEEQAHTSGLLASVPVSVTSKSKLLGITPVTEPANKLSSIRMMKTNSMSKLLLSTHSLNLPDGAAVDVKTELLLDTKRDSKTNAGLSKTTPSPLSEKNEATPFDVKLEAKFNELRASFEHLMKDVNTTLGVKIDTDINLFGPDLTAMDIDSEAIFELMSRSPLNVAGSGEKSTDQTAKVIAAPPSTGMSAFDLANKPSITTTPTVGKDVPTARSKDESDVAIQEILFGDKPVPVKASGKKSSGTKTTSADPTATPPPSKTAKSTKKFDATGAVPVESRSSKRLQRPQEVDGSQVTDEAILNKLNDLKNQFFKQHADSFPDHPATLQAQLQERAKNQASFAASLLKSGDSKQHKPFSQTPFSKLEKSQRVPYSQVIATRLEHMVKEFVFELDPSKKKKAIKACTAFWEEFDMSFPDMDYSEYKSNMELGQTFLDVAARIQEDGGDFVSQEVEEWQSSGLFTRTYSLPGPGEMKGTGLHSFAINVEMFEDLSFGDRNHLLIVCAFDVAFNALNVQLLQLQGQDLSTVRIDSTAVSLYNLFEIATAAAANPLMNSASQQEARIRLPSIHMGRKNKHSTVGSGAPAVSTESPTTVTPKTNKKKDKKQKSVSSTSPSTNAAGGAKDAKDLEKERSSLATSYSRLEREVTAALYEELLNGGNVDMTTLRSSMPMLNTDSEWTMRAIYLLLLITAGIIANLVYSEAQRKKNRSPHKRHGGGGSNSAQKGKGGVGVGVSTWVEDFVAMFDRNPPVASGGDEDSAGPAGDTASSTTTITPIALDESPYLTALLNILYGVYFVVFKVTAFLLRYSVIVVLAVYYVLNKLLTLLVDFYYSTQGASADVRHIASSSSPSPTGIDSTPTAATTSKSNKTKGLSANASKGLVSPTNSTARTAPTNPSEPIAVDTRAEANNLQGAVELMKILTTVASHLFTHIMNSVYAQFTSPSAPTSPVDKVTDGVTSAPSPVVETHVKSSTPVAPVAAPVSILSSSQSSATDDKTSSSVVKTNSSNKGNAGKKSKMSVSFSQSDLAAVDVPVVVPATITKAATIPSHTGHSANGKKGTKNGQRAMADNETTMPSSNGSSAAVDTFAAAFPTKPLVVTAPAPVTVKAKAVVASPPVISVSTPPVVAAPVSVPVVAPIKIAPSVAPVALKEKPPIVKPSPPVVPSFASVVTPLVAPVTAPVVRSTGGLTVIKTVKPVVVTSAPVVTAPVAAASVAAPVPALSQDWTHVTASSVSSAVRSKPLMVGAPVVPAAAVSVAVPIVLSNKPVTIAQLVDSALNTKRAVSVSLPATPATISTTFSFDESAFPAVSASSTATVPVSFSPPAPTPGPVPKLAIAPALSLPPPPPLRVHSSPESRGPVSSSYVATTAIPPSPVRVLASSGHVAPPGFIGLGVASLPQPLNGGLPSFGSFGFASNGANNNAVFNSPPSSKFSPAVTPQRVGPLPVAPVMMMPPPGMPQHANYNRPAPLSIAPPPSQSQQFINWTSASPLVHKPVSSASSVGYQAAPVRPNANYFGMSSQSVEEDEDGESYSLLESANAFLEGLDYAPVMSPVAARSSTSRDRVTNPQNSSNGSDDLFRQSFNRAESNYSSQSRRYEEQMSVEQHNNITLQALYSGLSPDAPSFRPSAYSQASQHRFAQPQFNNMFSYPEDDVDSQHDSVSSGSGHYYTAAPQHYQQPPQRDLFMQSSHSQHNQMAHHQMSSSAQQQQQRSLIQQQQQEEDELYSRMLSDLDHVADLISDDEDEE